MIYDDTEENIITKEKVLETITKCILIDLGEPKNDEIYHPVDDILGLINDDYKYDAINKLMEHGVKFRNLCTEYTY